MNAFVDHSLLDADIAALRVPPHSIEAESSVLGSLLLDNGGWDRVGDLLAESDFYRHEHKLVFSAISGLVNASKPADVITVFAALESAGRAEQVGGLTYLNALAQTSFSPGSIRRYAEIVRERAVLRKLISACDEISSTAFNLQGKAVDAVLDSAMQQVMAISPDVARDDWQSMETGVVHLLDRIAAQAEGTAVDDFTPTGLTAIDDRLDGGPRDGELVVIGARPGMGKSALALSMGLHMAIESRKAVGMFSMEMPKAQVVSRAMSVLSRIHLSRIKRGERLKDYDWPAITSTTELLRAANFHVSDRGNLNVNQVRASARALRRRHGKLACLIVDYLGLMAGIDPKMPRVYQIEEITKGLKSLAKELSCPIFLLCQLNRKVEERVDQMPVLSDLRDSGSVEQDADIVLFVHRPFKANPTLSDEWKHYAKVSVAKLRDGEPGIVDLMYIGENTRFQDWPKAMEIPTNKARIARNSRSDL